MAARADLPALPGPPRSGDAAASEAWLPALSGWLLMAAAVTQLGLREGAFFRSEHLLAAVVCALILTGFVFVLRPSLGTYYDGRAVLSALVIFATAAVGLSHVFDRDAAGLLFRGYAWLRSGLEWLMGKLIGAELAAFFSSPLYLFAALILAVSFAYRSTAVFVVFAVCLLLHGMVPPSAGVISMYLLWLAGFTLVLREPLFLPRRIEGRAAIGAAQRDLLLELRARPLHSGEALLLLGAPGMDAAAAAARAPELLRPLMDAGLLEYNPATGRIHATETLLASHTPQWVQATVNALSQICALLLFFCGLGYVVSPVDAVPDAVPAIGWMDDLSLGAFCAAPLAMNLLRMMGLRGRA